MINNKKLNLVIKATIHLCLIFSLLSSCSNNANYKNRERENIFSKYDPHNTKYNGHYKVGKKYKIKNKSFTPKKPKKNFVQIGEVSWYGKNDHGKKTANGEVFSRYLLTAAHQTLPLPSIIEVTNLKNKKKLILLVNDRGPFAKNRILDISEYAAHILGFKNHGSTKAMIKYLPKATDQFLLDIGLKKVEGARVIKNPIHNNQKYSINARIIMLNIKLLNNLKELNKNYFHAKIDNLKS